MPSEFSDYLTRRRKRHGLTQQALADYLGASLSVVSKWESGTRRPLPLTRAAIEVRLSDLDRSVQKPDTK